WFSVLCAHNKYGVSVLIQDLQDSHSILAFAQTTKPLAPFGHYFLPASCLTYSIALYTEPIRKMSFFLQISTHAARLASVMLSPTPLACPSDTQMRGGFCLARYSSAGPSTKLPPYGRSN